MFCGRAAATSAAASPARKRRERPAPGGRRSASVSERASAAGPCCQSAWLAVAHRLEPSAAMTVASNATRPSPSQRRS